MTRPRLTTAEWITAFAARCYHCHRCGRIDGETRGSDPAPAPLRFRLIGGELLLPWCEHCTPGGPTERAAADRALLTAVTDHHPPVDPWPLTPYRCSVTGCATLWHELSVAPPLVPIYHPIDEVFYHPCPWCLSDWPITSRHDHAALARRLLHRPYPVLRAPVRASLTGG